MLGQIMLRLGCVRGRKGRLTSALSASIVAFAVLVVWSADARAALNVVQSFAGIDEHVGGTYPPDTQLAVGPKDLVEVVNEAIYVYKRNGQLRGTLTPQHIEQTRHELNDPQVLWDQTSHRWFLSEDDESGNKVRVAVSEGKDPLRTQWDVTTIPTDKRHCIDQPILGVTDRVVAVTDLEYPGTCANPDNNGAINAYLIVLNKSQVMRRSGNISYRDELLPADQTALPIRSITGSRDMYIVRAPAYDTTSQITIERFVNAPPHGSLRVWRNVTIPALTPPPESAAYQPGGGQPLDLGSGRLQSGFVAGGRIWMTGESTCTPPGSTSAVSCVRLMAVDTSSGSLVFSSDVGFAGFGLAYPAIAPDAHGTVYTVYDDVSSSRDPSIGAFSYNPVAHSYAGAIDLVIGTSPLLDGMRWGDYSAASPDPADPNSVWVASEYGKSDHNWGTLIVRLRS